MLWQIYEPSFPLFARFLELLIASSVFWLPLALGYLLAQLWLYYVRAKWIKGLEWVLLEVRLPKDVSKPPQAMEIVLSAFHQPRDPEKDNVIVKWVKGERRQWFALELVSFGGEIHFYLRVPKGAKNQIEAQIYSQYPNVEVHETDDYVHNLSYGLPGSEWKIMGTELELTKEDAYPIKTYIDYGIDRLAEEPQSQVDPITPLLEYLGSLSPDEQAWIQIPIIATRDRFPDPKSWFGKQDWRKEAQKVIDKIRHTDEVKEGKHIILTPGETETLKAIERTLAKYAFDCGIRLVYFARGDAFSMARFGGLIGSFKQFGSATLNGFKPQGDKTTNVKYPWQDLTGRKLAKKKAQLFNAYRQRAYFYPPYVGKPFVLTTEELATIYHFPGQVATTPSLEKIESKRAEPPVNLPI